MFKYDKRSVSLDDIGVIPNNPVVVSDDDVDLSVKIGTTTIGVPIIAASMDSVTLSPSLLKSLSSAGTYGVVNLGGLISRYEYGAEMDAAINAIIANPTLSTLRSVYSVTPNMYTMELNITGLIKAGCNFAVSCTPQIAEEAFRVVMEKFDTIDDFYIQSSFITPNWSSKVHGDGLDICAFFDKIKKRNKNLYVGNVASVKVAKAFIDRGVDGIIEGIGPGCICSTREVCGIGAGHVSAITEIREYIDKVRSKTVLIADGGIHNSGDIVKLLCCGASAVMLGSMFAKTEEAHMNGVCYGMSAMHKVLPRGVINKYEISGSVNDLIFGTSDSFHGTKALVPAIKNALSNLGCCNVDQAYRNTLVVEFKGISTEGKGK